MRLPEEKTSCVLSACEGYRYRLERQWGDAPPITFLMVNPSTADDKVDDKTVLKLRAFSMALDAGGFVIGNLFAWRSTDPDALLSEVDPVGPENDLHLADMIGKAHRIICAWGAHKAAAPRATVVRGLLRTQARCPVEALRLTKRGAPEHPLYLPLNLKPFPYKVFF